MKDVNRLLKNIQRIKVDFKNYKDKYDSEFCVCDIPKKYICIGQAS